jgi:hypothetical protein
MNENEILFPPQRKKTRNERKYPSEALKHATKLMSRSKSKKSFSRPFYDPLSSLDTFKLSEFFNGLSESTSESFEQLTSRKVK